MLLQRGWSNPYRPSRRAAVLYRQRLSGMFNYYYREAA